MNLSIKNKQECDKCGSKGWCWVNKYKPKHTTEDYLSALLGLLVLVGLVIIGYKIGGIL